MKLNMKYVVPFAAALLLAACSGENTTENQAKEPVETKEVTSGPYTVVDDRGKEIYFMYYIYILSNSENRIFYIGVTNDLKRRIYEHKHKLLDGFTKKYNLGKLLYFEIFKDISRAIEREKQLKKWSRIKKITLIEAQNPGWIDLSEKI